MRYSGLRSEGDVEIGQDSMPEDVRKAFWDVMEKMNGGGWEAVSRNEFVPNGDDGYGRG